MNNLLAALFRSLEKVDLRIWLVGFILLRYQGWYVDSNGEQYLAYAKAFSDSNWFAHNFWFNDFAGTRYVFQLLFGWLLTYMSFEALSFWGRLAFAILMSFPLSRLFRLLQVPNLAAVCLFVLVYLSFQALYAGGQLVGGFETKYLAWFGVLYAVIALVEQQYLRAWLWLGFASYFHLLIGGWIAVVAGGFMLVDQVSWRKRTLSLGVYVLMVLPLLFYMYQGTLAGSQRVIQGISVDWIYVYMRNPHHLGLFHLGFDYFNRYFLVGMSLTVVIGVLSVMIWRKRFGQQPAGRLNMLLSVLIGQQILMWGVAALDSQGIILKSYPFRTSVLTCLFALILGYKYGHMRLKQVSRFWTSNTKLLFSVLILFWVVIKSATVIQKYTLKQLGPPYGTDYLALVSYIEEYTMQDDWLLSLDDRRIPQGLMRMTERNEWVRWKFIPTEPLMIYEWYVRMVAREQLLQGKNTWPRFLASHPEIGWIVSLEPLDQGGLTLAFQAGNYWLYRTKREDLHVSQLRGE